MGQEFLLHQLGTSHLHSLLIWIVGDNIGSTQIVGLNMSLKMNGVGSNVFRIWMAGSNIGLSLTGSDPPGCKICLPSKESEESKTANKNNILILLFGETLCTLWHSRWIAFVASSDTNSPIHCIKCELQIKNSQEGQLSILFLPLHSGAWQRIPEGPLFVSAASNVCAKGPKSWWEKSSLGGRMAQHWTWE
jgi:hypothetical protein